MLRLFNSLGKKIETFRPVNKEVVTIFTCGPSVYQRSHIGNFRTFLFEDVLVRYLEYSGYRVRRGMNFTDIEDKAFEEAARKKTSIRLLADKNIKEFLRETKLLNMKTPDYTPRASDTDNVMQAADLIGQLIDLDIAYRYRGDLYFDPQKFKGFGRLYGLDMSKWPMKKRRFHRDTYRGIHWNYGDFILWHGYKKGDTDFWDTPIGKGRPAWNVQDAGIVSRYLQETLSVYCGGVDNLVRHHDYSIAILEAIRPYPMARFWLHCQHLFVEGSKMSKSKGNIYYTDTLLNKGYSPAEIRFFLIYGHYRERLDYSDDNMRDAVDKLRRVKKNMTGTIRKGRSGISSVTIAQKIRRIFVEHMDNDFDVRSAFDGVGAVLSEAANSDKKYDPAAIVKELRKIEEVLMVDLLQLN